MTKKVNKTEKQYNENINEVGESGYKALTVENREKQLIALAVDLAEKQLIEGTASPSVITHYLKLASSRERIEKEILERQAQLITAKTDRLNSEKHLEEVWESAMEAMKRYRRDE